MGNGSTTGKAIPIDLPDFHTALYRDFVAGGGRVAELAEPLFRDSGRWKSIAEHALSSATATEELWDETESFNKRLGASESALKSIQSLSQRKSVVVVAGQQPGLMGGPLLVLYKAATAVALSEYVTEVAGVPCCAVFVVASDDSDLAEIARCTLYDGTLRRLTLQFSGEGFSAGRMVGSLSVDEERRLANSLKEVLADRPGGASVAALLDEVGDRAGDHGEFVAGLLCSIFSSKGLVLIDGRSSAMRRAGAALFGSYLSHAEKLRVAVGGASKRLIDMGYHAQISESSLGSWLFLIEDGIRKKSTAVAEDALERIVADSPHSLSPNVALRPIWRDSILPTVSCICGPSEVAYTIQLKEAYEILGVRMPVLFPRLSASLVPGEAEEQAGEWSEASVKNLLIDFDGTRARHYRGLIPRSAAEALETTRSSLEQSMAGLAGTLRGHSERWGGAADSVRRAAAKGLDRLELDMVDGIRRDAQKANPRLKGLADFLLPDGKLQERTVALLLPLLEENLTFVRDILELARIHVKESASGRVRHYCRRL